jgi:hypothetical protein
MTSWDSHVTRSVLLTVDRVNGLRLMRLVIWQAVRFWVGAKVFNEQFPSWC